MTRQHNRISYPVHKSVRMSNGSMFTEKHVGYWNIILTKKGAMRSYIKLRDGDAIWTSPRIMKEFVRWIEQKAGRYVNALSVREKEIMYGRSLQDRLHRNTGIKQKQKTI